MAKYNELIVEFSEEIGRIKALNVKQDEISQRLNEAYQAFAASCEGEDIGDVDCGAIENEMADNQIALHQAQESLTHEVDMAYWDVPFAKSRNQGIAKFWELSGITVGRNR